MTNDLRLITAAEAKGDAMIPLAASVKKRRNLKKIRIENIRNKYMMQKIKAQ